MMYITVTFHGTYKISISSLFNIRSFGFSISREHNENHLLAVKFWMPD